MMLGVFCCQTGCHVQLSLSFNSIANTIVFYSNSVRHYIGVGAGPAGQVLAGPLFSR